MKNPITAILQMELETVTDALAATRTFALEGEERDHWIGRLRDVNRALAIHIQATYLTEAERATLLLLIEFHDGVDEAPFNTQAAESARAKLKG